MARIDKVTQVVRAPAGQAFPPGILGVKISTGGSVIVSGTADAIGVVCPGGTIAIARPIGVLVRGEIVEAGLGAGSVYYAPAGGTLTTTATNANKVGFTVEGDRLVVAM